MRNDVEAAEIPHEVPVDDRVFVGEARRRDAHVALVFEHVFHLLAQHERRQERHGEWLHLNPLPDESTHTKTLSQQQTTDSPWKYSLYDVNCSGTVELAHLHINYLAAALSSSWLFCDTESCSFLL